MMCFLALFASVKSCQSGVWCAVGGVEDKGPGYDVTPEDKDKDKGLKGTGPFSGPFSSPGEPSYCCCVFRGILTLQRGLQGHPRLYFPPR